MSLSSDHELLGVYAKEGSEAAFGELVQRHIDMVHSAAWRMLGEPHLAEDVTQSVFIALAQQARAASRAPVLAAWLYRTTRNQALRTLRDQSRRQARELATLPMNDQKDESTWESLTGKLDAAMSQLTEADRAAVLLRYFQQKSAREMAEILGTSEAAAQKRVGRAVEKLRGLLAEQGVALPATALVSLIAANAVASAPVGLAAAVTSASLSAGSVASISTLGILKIMVSAKTKLIIGSVVATAAAGSLVLQHQQINSLRSQNQIMASRLAAVSRVISAIEKPLPSSPDDDELARLRRDREELLRLRGQVAALRSKERQLDTAIKEAGDEKELAGLLKEAAELSLRASGKTRSESTLITPKSIPGKLQTSTLTNVGGETPEAILQTGLHAIFHDDVNALKGHWQILDTNTPPSYAERQAEQVGREQLASIRHVWRGVEQFTKLRFAHVKDDRYALIFDFDYGANGRPDGAPTSGSISLKKIDDRWMISNFGWQNN